MWVLSNSLLNILCLPLSLQTYIGHVVISVNPYRQLDIYSQEYVTEYRSRNIFELPPHVYVCCRSELYTYILHFIIMSY